jgi:hypothetical protein
MQTGAPERRERRRVAHPSRPAGRTDRAEHSERRVQCYDAGGKQLVIPMNANNGLRS